MKVGFFLLKFPVASETFVLNQIVAFIEMGFEVEIVAMHKGGLAQTHAAWQRFRLAERTTWLLDEPENRLGKLKFRAARTLKGAGKLRTWRALNGLHYGAVARNLILSAVCGCVAGQITADVFIAHFDPAGVTAVKLRELGVLRGKIATVFHGVDVSHRAVLARYLLEYRRLFARGDIMLPISNLWATRLREMGCAAQKITVSRMGVNMDTLARRPVKLPGRPLEMISVVRLTEKKGLHVAIEACRLLKQRGVDFRYNILGIGPWERRLHTLIEQYQLEERVFMQGFKTSDEVKSLLNAADLFLLPSVTDIDGDMEGIPVALMEAMAVGIPVIATQHSGIPELIDAGESGWRVPENDPAALAASLQHFISLDHTALEPLLVRARRKVETEFNQQVIYRVLSGVLGSL